MVGMQIKLLTLEVNMKTLTRALALAIILFSSTMLLTLPVIGIGIGFSSGSGSDSISASSTYELDSSTALSESVVARDKQLSKDSTIIGTGKNKIKSSISSDGKLASSTIDSNGKLYVSTEAQVSSEYTAVNQDTTMTGNSGSMSYKTDSPNNDMVISSGFDGDGGNLKSSITSISGREGSAVSGNVDSMGISLLDSESMSIIGSSDIEMDVDAIYATSDGKLGRIESSASNIITGPLYTADGGDADAYLLTGKRWNTKDPQLKFVLKNDAYLANEGITAVNVQTAIEAAANTWDAASNQNLFADSSLVTVSSTVATDRYNKINTVNWQPFLNNCLAYSRTWYKSALVDGYKTIVDSDIVFNTKYAWRTEGTVGADVQTIALHELGHSLGLGDLYTSADSEQTMYGYYTHVDRTIGNGDAAGIWTLYG